MRGCNTQAEYRKQLAMTGIKLLHFLLSAGIFYLFWLYFRYGTFLPVRSTGFRYNYFVAVGYGFLLRFFLHTYNGYLIGYSGSRVLAVSEFVSQLLSAGIVYVLVSIGWNDWRSCWSFFPMLSAQAVLDLLWVFLASRIFFKLYPAKRTLLIYRNPADKKRVGNIGTDAAGKLYKICGEQMFDGSFSEIRDSLRDYDAVIVVGVNSRCRNGILKYCKETGKAGFFLPHVGDVIMQQAMHIQCFDSPLLYVSRSLPRPEYRIVKRLFDIVLSGACLLLFSPLLAAIGIAVRLGDGAPVLYKQVRLTKDGKPFKIWKFRSMRVDAEGDGVARLSTGDLDERITPVGRFLRKYRLDELPQLFNVLKGDMSFVGPRPERPEIAEQYARTIPDFRLRLQVKAGLTGYAQVYGKYNTAPHEKLEFDLLYINQMSVLTDLKLIFATLFVLFNKSSTQGVEADGQTAVCEEKADRAGNEDAAQ